LLLLAVPAAPLRASSDALAEARALAAEGSNDQALKLYEQAASEPPPSAATFFELGQLALKMDQPSRAVLAFQRALLLDPAFLPAREGLARAQTELALPLPHPHWSLLVQQKVSLDLLPLLGAVLFWGGAFLLAGLGFARRRFPVLRTLGSLACLLGLALVALTFVCDPRWTAARDAVVVGTGGTPLLKSPEPNAATVAPLPEGSTVSILNQHGRWFYGKSPTGAEGWFAADAVRTIVPPPQS
jgi:tetratricopeptide (TPR) repeat protein